LSINAAIGYRGRSIPGGLRVLILKLLLIPGFLLLISLAGKRWGPSVAGWLSGLPVVVGPILFFLAIEQGPRLLRNRRWRHCRRCSP
jgi:chromate transport protein ChrA